MQRLPGLLVLQSLARKRFPEPDLSQKRSGRLCRIVLPITVLFVGGVPLGPRTTATPPL